MIATEPASRMTEVRQRSGHAFATMLVQFFGGPIDDGFDVDSFASPL